MKLPGPGDARYQGMPDDNIPSQKNRGANFRIELNTAKQKYLGCFNNTKSAIRQQINEMMLLKLIETYCLPRLLYGCEIWPIDTLNMH